MTDSMDVEFLEQFLNLPPPPRAVKILVMIMKNLVTQPDEPKFRSILVEKVKERFEKNNVPWHLVIEILASVGFSREANDEGRIEVVNLDRNAANHLLDLFKEVKKQKKQVKKQEIHDEEILRAMHSWDLPPEIEKQLNAMIDQIRMLWIRQGDLIIDFFTQSNRSVIDRSVISIAIDTLVKNHTAAQLRNWPSQEVLLHNVPEFNGKQLLQETDGKSGVLTLIEDILSEDLNARCFRSVLYASAQAGNNDLDYVLTCAGGRKVALVQLTNGLLELFTTYRVKLSEKMTQGVPTTADKGIAQAES